MVGTGEGCVMSTQEYTKKVIEDVGEDEDFKSGSWVSATDYVNANGGIVSRCLGDIKNFLKNGKLDKVVTIVKSCSPNVIGDLTLTLKDLSGAALILDNISVFTPKPSMHYLNITMRNVVKVFRKDTIPGSGSGMLMEEEKIVKLMKDEEMADLKLQVCGNVTDQEMADEEVLNLVLDEEERQAQAEQEWLEELVADSHRLQDRMKVDSRAGSIGRARDAVRCLDHMREIVRRDSAKLVVLEQLLAGTYVGIGLKDSYVADMEENE
ncbi:reverse transcriptase zinc-binding domain-containing protein [Tanacetum coccineum]